MEKVIQLKFTLDIMFEYLLPLATITLIGIWFLISIITDKISEKKKRKKDDKLL